VATLAHELVKVIRIVSNRGLGSKTEFDKGWADLTASPTSQRGRTNTEATRCLFIVEHVARVRKNDRSRASLACPVICTSEIVSVAQRRFTESKAISLGFVSVCDGLPE
jgi:hypothetical protein